MLISINSMSQHGGVPYHLKSLNGHLSIHVTYWQKVKNVNFLTQDARGTMDDAQRGTKTNSNRSPEWLRRPKKFKQWQFMFNDNKTYAGAWPGIPMMHTCKWFFFVFLFFVFFLIFFLGFFFFLVFLNNINIYENLGNKFNVKIVYVQYCNKIKIFYKQIL